MVTKTLTHQVRFPALTDIAEFVGAYRMLFESIGMTSTINFFPCEHFNHPIPEEQVKLTEGYMNTYQIFQNAWYEHGSSLRNTGVTIGHHFAIFVFEYEEAG